MTNEPPEQRDERWLKRGLQVLGGVLLLAVGAFVVLVQFVDLAMHPYRIPSSAMEPTLHCPRPGPGCEAGSEDRVLVPRFLPSYSPSRGDVIVFHTPPRTEQACGAGGTFVKRIIGLPGETVSEDHTGFVHVDGRRLAERYIQANRRLADSAHFGRTWKVPEGQYFVLGDNRAQSCDSREWGSVPRSNIIGPVVALYWPLDRIGSL